MRRAAVASAFFVALLALWQAVVMSGRWSVVLLPAPSDVLIYLRDAFADGTRTHCTIIHSFRCSQDQRLG
jgi:ABC-type nitrate/sulfonate/bicarbonate transport system permease component